MAYIDVRIEFDEEEYPEEEYTDYRPVSARLIATDIPENALNGIGESAFQSDLFTIGVSNAVLACLDGRRTVKVKY